MTLTTIPHPVLAKPCTPVPSEDLKAGRHTALLERMRREMIENNGVGLAANQSGEDLALFVIEKGLATEHGVPDAFANPEITEYGREQDILEEGCLSIPGFWVPVKRSRKIMFKALDEHGEKVKFRARGMLARVLQHETDHLNGLTIKERSAPKAKRKS